MDSHTAPTVDVSAFRKAMGSFPTGVTVVTVAYGDGDMHGLSGWFADRHRPAPTRGVRYRTRRRAPDQTRDLAPSISLVRVIAEGSGS